MSGPRDRSSDPDAQWPTEDLGQSSGNRAARDPGSEGAPGWDDWPAPPPPDDYLIEQPLPPSSDPWAESWTQEDADAMLRSASGEPPRQPDRWEPPAPEPAPEREPEREPEPEPEREPEPEPEPRPPVEPAWRSEPEAVEPGAIDADAGAATPPPRIEPWSPDPDPWRFEPEPVEVSPAAPQPEPEPEPELEPPAREAVAEPELEAVPDMADVVAPLAEEPAPAVDEPAPPPAASWPPRTDHLPDWLAEPLPDDRPAPAADPRAELAASPPDQPVDEPVETPAVPETPVEPEAAAAPPVEEPEAPYVPEPPEESAGFWDSILPWRSTRAEPAEIDGGPEPPAEREPGTEAEPREARAEPDWPEAELPWGEPDEPAATARTEETQAIEPRWPASVPEPDTELPPAATAEPEPQAAPPVPPPFVPIGGGLTYDRAEPEPPPSFIPIGGGLTYDRAGPEPEPEPEPTAAHEPESEPAVAGVGQDAWRGSEWPDAGESTRVLPTDWTPSQPEASRSGELEPSTGPIRVRLAEPDTDADLDEELANPTIAEQAVPWLIGVILLLAGMVIVLLALIFAGDGSLGGGAPNATPSPTLAAVGGVGSGSPTPTPTSAPTSSTPATYTPAPTPTPTAEPAPEYAPLEMVYQGRSAALAPIYLLHRDFEVEEEPAVMAQDAELDVRRFAWAPGGRAGAGLLADVLVSIEPGEEKRRLGDGLSTITFGDDASTVYAVRITEDGADDSATVLAIDFTSGETEELASVTYERPLLGDEAALAEAAFSDDGGAVRLFWMADDTLRLWVLGAGAWTIDPASGDVTELDGEPLPTLVAPNGRERITTEVDDGVTTLELRDMNDRRLATTTIEGMVSHLRWAPGGDMVVFTVGRAASGGGVIQNLFLWYLEDGEDPIQLTATGAAFGAEWRGTQPRWRE